MRSEENAIDRAIPERVHLSLSPPEGVALALAPRRMWPLGLFFGAFFLVLAWIALGQVWVVGGSSIEDIFDLTFVLFHAFWLLGWSVGVVILGALTVLFLFYDESARLTSSDLIYVPRLGPLHLLLSYDLGRIGNVRVEEATGDSDDVRIRFDYGDGTTSLGNDMSRPAAGRVVSAIEQAANARGSTHAEPVAHLPGFDATKWLRRTVEESPRPHNAVVPGQAAPSESVGGRAEPPAWGSASVLALLLANLVPLVGVLAFGWDLGAVMVLFWAESGVIGFYALLRLCYVAGWGAIFLGPFFLAHFGGFMAGHFFFIYALFIRGVEADGTVAAGADAGVLETLSDVFGPLYLALLALFLSHGISFFTNFLRRREYAGRDPSEQMKEPYKRIVVMHISIIFGGWFILALGTPAWALVLLVVLKTGVDLAAHRKEHGAR